MKTVTLLGILLLAAAPVMAQPAAPDLKPAPGTEATGPHVDQRIEQMHRRLRIRPDQEAAWNAFAQVMRSNAAATEQAYHQHAANVGTLSAVDNLRAFTQIEQTRVQGLQALLASFETLYGGLSADQKQTADAIFRRQEERAAQHQHG
jgi:hypothetical protein